MAEQMSAFSGEDLEDIDLGNGNVVKVKKYISAGDDAEIDSMAYRAEVVNVDGEVQMRMVMDPGTFVLARVCVLTKDWNGPMFMQGGVKVACTKENIKKLRKQVCDQIAAKLNEIISNDPVVDAEMGKGGSKSA